ncbi:hypothetical protein [Amycolatopsis australiensis]|uniref:Uncharacterized protein n=1 Tax=Amycolatopsis australiensis TaxID=546364 RepID=A0A1K1QXZ1_9PSEU|nr:hypothetical protein [Amycolatopsis australiensis]SFW64182.1 hypothetical protein SAMN04489730_2326 [Amycolatopsis australiensis]
MALVAKYDEAARNGQAEDWTSSDDIGDRFGGEVLSTAEYYRVENRYVDFVRSLAVSCGAGEFVVRAPTVTKSLPSWVPFLRSGLVVDLKTAPALVRRMLRGSDLSCVLCSDELWVSVETDFYLAVEAEDRKVAESARRFGLHVYRADNWSWFEVDDDTAALGRPSRDFPQQVRLSCGADEPLVLLERRVNGPGAQRWHLLHGADSLDWTLQLPPGVALAALPDVCSPESPRTATVTSTHCGMWTWR